MTHSFVVVCYSVIVISIIQNVSHFLCSYLLQSIILTSLNICLCLICTGNDHILHLLNAIYFHLKNWTPLLFFYHTWSTRTTCRSLVSPQVLFYVLLILAVLVWPFDRKFGLSDFLSSCLKVTEKTIFLKLILSVSHIKKICSKTRSEILASVEGFYYWLNVRKHIKPIFLHLTANFS